MTSQRHNQIRAIEAGGGPPIDRLLAPLRTFIHDETSAGILLIAATESDQQVETFEFVLQKIVRRHLAPLSETHSTSIHYHTLKPLLQDCDVVLSAMANAGGSNAGEVEKAFRTGTPHLGAKEDGLQLLPREECGLKQLDTALDRLALAAPQIKRQLIEACAHVVGADGLIQEREAELLRAIADTLDCPIPPIIQASEIASDMEGSTL